MPLLHLFLCPLSYLKVYALSNLMWPLSPTIYYIHTERDSARALLGSNVHNGGVQGASTVSCY